MIEAAVRTAQKSFQTSAERLKIASGLPVACLYERDNKFVTDWDNCTWLLNRALTLAFVRKMVGEVGRGGLRNDLIPARVKAQVVFSAVQTVRAVFILGETFCKIIGDCPLPTLGTTVR